MPERERERTREREAERLPSATNSCEPIPDVPGQLELEIMRLQREGRRQRRDIRRLENKVVVLQSRLPS